MGQKGRRGKSTEKIFSGGRGKISARQLERNLMPIREKGRGKTQKLTPRILTDICNAIETI